MSGNDKNVLITNRELHLEIGGVLSNSGPAWRGGGSVEFGHCNRELTACADTGFGIQVTSGTTDTHIEAEKARISDTSFVAAAPFLRLGVLFNPGKVVSLGPVVRFGVGFNFADVSRIQNREPYVSNQTIVNSGTFIQTGLRTLFSMKRFGVAMELGAAKYPAVPHADGEFPSTLGFFAQSAAMINF